MLFYGMDRLPESRLVTDWIPRGVSGFTAGMDRLPESRVMTRIIPGILVAFGRICDELADHLALLGRELFLVNREELRHRQKHNGLTHLAWALQEGLYRIGLMPGKYIPHRAPDDLRYGTKLTNAISFGLLLGTLGIIAAIVYVFIRMGT